MLQRLKTHMKHFAQMHNASKDLKVICIHALASEPTPENVAAALCALEKLQVDLEGLKTVDNAFLKTAMPVITAAANFVAVPPLTDNDSDEAALADVLARNKFGRKKAKLTTFN